MLLLREREEGLQVRWESVSNTKRFQPEVPLGNLGALPPALLQLTDTGLVRGRGREELSGRREASIWVIKD